MAVDAAPGNGRGNGYGNGRGAGPGGGMGGGGCCAKQLQARGGQVSGARGAGRCGGDACDGACALVPTISGSITVAPAIKAGLAADLQAQADEERAAGDLYREFGAKYALRPFQHIPQAEARHEAALRDFAAAAGMDLKTGEPGQYASPDIQALYDKLLTEGNASVVAALRTGAFVEERDILDLRRLQEKYATVPELLPILSALETGSEHHLNAFVRMLAMRGEIYEPQLLEAGDYAALIES